jgi:hypothetical protein
MQNQVEMRKKKWSKLIIQCNSTQNQTNFIHFWAKKNDHYLGLFSTILCLRMLYELTPLTCS